MAEQQNPVWQHTEDGLVIRIGHRADRLPPEVGAWLIGPDGTGTSADVAVDLLTLDGRFSKVVAELTRQVEQAEWSVQERRWDRAEAAGPWWSLPALRRRGQAERALRDAIGHHEDAVSTLKEAWALQHMLREYVIELDAPWGLLAEAARGWQRSTDVPGHVIVFAGEDAFLAGDARRGDGSFGFSSIVGDVFGQQWRRDGDEEDFEPLERSGPWTIGYIPRTGEIYAARHSGYLPDEVWLLGAGFTDTASAHALLTELEPRMREPNSLLLAAELVHAARPLQASGELRLPPPRSDADQDSAAAPPSPDADTADEPADEPERVTAGQREDD
jgi:hypothetical protein